ncbi:unnamed protein product [Rangifer tarandus platyrhynchus]|uniref:Uncharacterized protein n=2 Tax=Rangifer tarandus platyrhynchus TaxID=3082113 RepID=A0AC59YJX4_RANTA|nr:unnamed protein product [Rangifer tarandus platyrhynchus]
MLRAREWGRPLFLAVWVGESAVWYISTEQTSFPFDCKIGDISVPQILTHPSRLVLGSHPWRPGRGWPLPHQLVAVMRSFPPPPRCVPAVSTVLLDKRVSCLRSIIHVKPVY